MEAGDKLGKEQIRQRFPEFRRQIDIDAYLARWPSDTSAVSTVIWLRHLQSDWHENVLPVPSVDQSKH